MLKVKKLITMKWMNKHKGKTADGKIVTGDGTSRFKKAVKNKRLLAMVILVAFALAASGAYWLVSKNDTPSDKQDVLTIENDEVVYSDQQEKEQKKFDNGLKALKKNKPAGVDKDFQVVYEEVRSSSPAEWDKAAVDKAHYSLQYADLTGSFAEVNTLLSLIAIAEQNDIKVNNNQYNIGEEERKEIRKRASTAAKEVTNEGGEN